MKCSHLYKFQGDSIREEVFFDPPIKAYDQDFGVNASITYKISGGNEGGYFEMDPMTGQLYLLKQIDREDPATQEFNLQIIASQINTPLRHATADVHIGVVDINDNLPQFVANLYNISIMENLPVGFSVVQVTAHDVDQVSFHFHRFG